MPERFGIKTVFPHQQTSGKHVCFLQFTTRPPKDTMVWLLPAIKESGNAFRPGPPGYSSGWHIHDPKEVAKRVKRRWPELSEALIKVARFLRRHPDDVPNNRESNSPEQRPRKSTHHLDVLVDAALGSRRKRSRLHIEKVDTINE